MSGLRTEVQITRGYFKIHHTPVGTCHEVTKSWFNLSSSLCTSKQCFDVLPVCVSRTGSSSAHFNLFLYYIVRLSLPTMTNPNQLCDVLLFVCSKMTDETNLSS